MVVRLFGLLSGKLIIRKNLKRYGVSLGISSARSDLRAV